MPKVGSPEPEPEPEPLPEPAIVHEKREWQGERDRLGAKEHDAQRQEGWDAAGKVRKVGGGRRNKSKRRKSRRKSKRKSKRKKTRKRKKH